MRYVLYGLTVLFGMGSAALAAEPPQHLREVLDAFPHYPPYDAVAGTMNSASAKFGTNESMESVLAFYREQLAEGGWSIEDEHAFNGFFYLAVKRGDISVHVDIRDESDLPRMARRLRTAVSIRLLDESVEHCRTDVDPTEDPAARALLDEMIARYASLDTYRDRGHQRTQFRPGHSSALQFMTVFQRPGKFRFEFENDGHTYVVHQDGGAVQTYWTVTRELDRGKTIELALAGAHGVSSGTATTVADLLGVTEDGSLLTDLRDLQLVGEKVVNGVLCQGIQGFDRRCTPSTLWIGKEDLLLRRIEDGSVLPGFTTESVTNYEPEANIALTAEDLAFDQHGRLPKSGGLWSSALRFFRYFF